MSYDVLHELSQIGGAVQGQGSVVKGVAAIQSGTTMSYDGQGHRIGRSTEVFVYDGDSLVFHYAPSAGGTFYIWGPTGPIQEYSPTASPSFITTTYNFDPNGSTISRIDGGLLDSPHLYDAFGEPVWAPVSDNGGGTVSGGLMLRYKGQAGYYTDTDYDLIYCWHRYYDPQAGRWITRDPIGLDGGINTYQYCDDSPLAAVDPSGLQNEPAWMRLFGNPQPISATMNDLFGVHTSGDAVHMYSQWFPNNGLGAAGGLGLLFNVLDKIQRGDVLGAGAACVQGSPWMMVVSPEGVAEAFGAGVAEDTGFDLLLASRASWRPASESGALPMTMSLGPYPEYLEAGARNGWKTFATSSEIYTNWEAKQALNNNFKSIDRIVARGGNFHISTAGRVRKGSMLEEEIEYIIETHRYRRIGQWLVP